MRALLGRCRFPDCTHTHEADCAVKDAVADGLLDVRRWESCRQLARGEERKLSLGRKRHAVLRGT